LVVHGKLGKKKSCRGEHGRRPTFGTNELIFTETKFFETKVVPRGMLYTMVYYRFKKNNKNINSTKNTKLKQNTRKQKLWSQKQVQKKI